MFQNLTTHELNSLLARLSRATKVWGLAYSYSPADPTHRDNRTAFDMWREMGIAQEYVLDEC